jgi:hypothetical protein
MRKGDERTRNRTESARVVVAGAEKEARHEGRREAEVKKKPRSENERAEDEERRGNEGGRLSRD